MVHYSIEHLSFSYPASGKKTLDEINLTIYKGDYHAGVQPTPA